jgi:HEAT repeat protein
MRQLWPKVVLIGGLLISALLAARLIVPAEPRYQGKRLSDWFDLLYQSEPRLKQVQHAIREIGTNAVPLLLKKVRDNDKLRDSLLIRLHRAAWLRLPLVLQRVFPKPKAWDSSVQPRTRWALGLIGVAAVPSLLSALDDPNVEVRFVAIEAIGLLDADPNVTVPALAKVLRDSNPEVRLRTVQVLGEIGRKSKQAIPVLVSALADSNAGEKAGMVAPVREAAADGLGRIGPQAHSAVPQLTRLLIHTNGYTREQAAIALWMIDRSTNSIPLLASELQQASDAEIFVRMLTTLGEMGSVAQSAVPAIRGSLTNSYMLARRFNCSWSLGEAVSVKDHRTGVDLIRVGKDALRKINPEAATSLEADLITCATKGAVPAEVVQAKRHVEHDRLRAEADLERLSSEKTAPAPPREN